MTIAWRRAANPSAATLPACRAHFAFVYLNVFWASWLIVEYYKAGGAGWLARAA